jgi:hypothetical protein
MLNFELTLEEANVILGSLGKQPYEVVSGIINKIQAQAQPQLPALEAKMREDQEVKAKEEKSAKKLKAEPSN